MMDGGAGKEDGGKAAVEWLAGAAGGKSVAKTMAGKCGERTAIRYNSGENGGKNCTTATTEKSPPPSPFAIDHS